MVGSARRKRTSHANDNIANAGLWNFDIGEISGFIIETKGREELNAKLAEGWILLHIYTLKFREGDEWRERPMAIVGKPRRMHAGLGSQSRGNII